MSVTYYTADHEWIRVEGGLATIGITDHAQEQLGDLVFVGLPEVGSTVARGDSVVVVESVKAASDVYAPVDGEISEINEAVAADSALVNGAAESEGWLWRMRLADPAQLDGLMNRDAYLETIK